MTMILLFVLFSYPIAKATTISSNEMIKDNEKSETKEALITHLDSLQKYGIFLDEVVINSIKHDRNLQLEPMAATSFNVSDLKSQQINDVKSLSQIVPNLYAPDYGSVLTSPIYIRGIGNKLSAPSVGLYVDGVPFFEKSAFDFSFTDIARIEVLRGPQGTLYGRNTMGGVIDITTSSPLKRQGNSIGFTAGKYGQTQVTASTSHKLSNRVGIALSGVYNSYDGYFKNTFDNTSADKRKNGAGRMKLVWDINDAWDFQLSQLVDYTSQNGYPYSLYNEDTRDIDPIDYNEDSNYRRLLSSSGLRIHYQSDKLQFTSQSSFLFLQDHNGIDQDFSNANTYYVTQENYMRNFSQEFTAKYQVSKHYSAIVGAYISSENTDRQSDMSMYNLNYKTIKDRNLPTSGIAVFHQSNWTDFIPNWTFSAGVRYDYTYAKMDYQSWKKPFSGTLTKVLNTNPKESYAQWSPKITLQYRLPHEQQLYGSITRGYQTGGFNTSFDTEADMAYDEEYSWNYEAGLRIHTLDRKYTAELTFFYIDWKNQQVYKLLASGHGSMLQNAGQSHSKGIELSLYANPINALELRADVGYTEAKFDDYTYGVTDYKNNYLPMVPKETISLNADYNWNKPMKGIDHLVFGLNYIGTGHMYWKEDNEVSR
ncbi:MAG: TonB-dependent receptor, partial [Bacteroidaceae bacterium]